MNMDNAKLLMEMLGIECPFCNEIFKYRVNLRQHLIGEHSDTDAKIKLEVLKKIKKKRKNISLSR